MLCLTSKTIAKLQSYCLPLSQLVHHGNNVELMQLRISDLMKLSIEQMANKSRPAAINHGFVHLDAQTIVWVINYD